MSPKTLSLVSLILFGEASLALAQAEPEEPQVRSWTIDGVRREAIVLRPSAEASCAAPVVFVFHGHGGRMQQMVRLGFQQHWPEAVIVCPQGLPTPTGRDPEGKRSGWQQEPGAFDDRDVKFFDAMLETLKTTERIDENAIFATGHSNGGGFAYVLLAARGDRLEAVAASSCGARALRGARDLKPRPILHLAGERDQIVPFRNQKRVMEAIRKHNQAAAEGEPWAKAGDLVGTLYASDNGAPFVTLIHPGGHRYPDEAPALIVRFFQEQQRSSASRTETNRGPRPRGSRPR